MRIPRNHDAELLSSHASYNQHNDGLPWHGERFKDEIGVMTGIVGAFGGLGGFLLPNYILGPLKQATGGHVAGFMTLACIVLTVTLVFYAVSRSWRKSWATLDSNVKF